MVVEFIYILTNLMQNLSVGLMQSGLTEQRSTLHMLVWKQSVLKVCLFIDEVN